MKVSSYWSCMYLASMFSSCSLDGYPELVCDILSPREIMCICRPGLGRGKKEGRWWHLPGFNVLPLVLNLKKRACLLSYQRGL